MSEQKTRLVVPTGRIHAAVLDLLDAAGVSIPRTEKNYRPRASDPRYDVKLMKAANVPTLVELGKHDAGFTGFDWVRESGADVEIVLDVLRFMKERPAAKVLAALDPARAAALSNMMSVNRGER